MPLHLTRGKIMSKMNIVATDLDQLNDNYAVDSPQKDKKNGYPKLPIFFVFFKITQFCFYMWYHRKFYKPC